MPWRSQFPAAAGLELTDPVVGRKTVLKSTHSYLKMLVASDQPFCWGNPAVVSSLLRKFTRLEHHQVTLACIF